MKRLSRSDSSMMVASRSAFSASVSAVARSRNVPAAPSTAASGVLRSCEIEVSSAERSRSVSIGALRAVDILDQAYALDRERGLIDQGIEQTALIGREQRPGLVAVDADDADGAAPRSHGQKQAFCARKRIRAASRGTIVLPRPFGGRDIGVVQHVLRRIAGLDRDRAVLRQQQHDPDLEHERGLIGRRPQYIVERAHTGKLAAERIEQLDRAHALMRGHGPGSTARGKMRHDHRYDGEERESARRWSGR